jgi:hypothetical protein
MPLLSIEDLASRLRTTPAALYCRRSRNVQALPPNILIPGDSRLLFDESVVEQWLSDPTCSCLRRKAARANRICTPCRANLPGKKDEMHSGNRGCSHPSLFRKQHLMRPPVEGSRHDRNLFCLQGQIRAPLA